jgi:hypothetical protein
MNPQVPTLRTEADYRQALKAVDAYFEAAMDPDPGSETAFRLGELITQIEAYELAQDPVTPREADGGAIDSPAAPVQPVPAQANDDCSDLRALDRMARDTFASTFEAARWLRRPHPIFEDQSPLDIARTPGGVKRVKDILVAIKHGGVV